ncbi:MAG: hypothetical protein HKN04_04655 [Rhodothermaceae bacterium]|nr:hypothetical protein [Rhodothermaceae bacterium]
MPFFELLAIVSVTLGLPSIVLYNLRRMVEARALAKQTPSDGLRMSELQTLIEAAVDDATEPLRVQIEALQRAQPVALLEAPEETDLLTPEREQTS